MKKKLLKLRSFSDWWGDHSSDEKYCEEGRRSHLTDYTGLQNLWSSPASLLPASPALAPAMRTQTSMALSLLAATMLGREYHSNIQAAVKCIFIAKYPEKSEESWKFLFWSNNKWISNHLFKLSVVAREFFLCEICDKWHCSNLNFYLFSSARAPN